MSADLEKLAQWYRNEQGDTDIAQILEGVAQVSRRRERPETALVESNAVEVMSEKPQFDQAVYFKLQNEILDTFIQIAPRTNKPYNREKVLSAFRQFNEKYGKHIPDNTLLTYLVPQGRLYSPHIESDQEVLLLEKQFEINQHVELKWYEILRKLAGGRESKFVTLGEARDASIGQLTKVRNIGLLRAEMFLIALSR